MVKAVPSYYHCILEEDPLHGVESSQGRQVPIEHGSLQALCLMQKAPYDPLALGYPAKTGRNRDVVLEASQSDS
jgi:hypothetical protein